MITMMYGFPGAGKSAHSVKYFVIEMLKSGMNVYTNIAGLNPIIIQQFYGVDISLLHIIDKSDLSTFWRLTQADPSDHSEHGIENTIHPAMFVIDEVQNVFGSSPDPEQKDRIKSIQHEAKLYTTKHRHRRDSVVFLCQDPDMVAKFIRDLSEHWSHVRKANFMFGANTTTYIVNHRKGGRKGKPLASNTYKYDMKACACYSSTRDGGKETKTASDSVTTSWFKILWPIPVVLTMIGMGVYMFKKSSSQSPTLNANKASSPANKTIVAFDSDSWVCDALTGCDWYLKGKYVAHSDSVPVVAVGDHDFNGMHIRAIGASLDRYGDSSTVPPMADTRNGDTGPNTGNAGSSVSFGGPGPN